MRLKNLAAIAAASSLMLVSSPALSSPASRLSLAHVDRASASSKDESKLLDSGMMGFLLVFGAGAVVGALLYSVIKGKSSDTPVSP